MVDLGQTGSSWDRQGRARIHEVQLSTTVFTGTHLVTEVAWELMEMRRKARRTKHSAETKTYIFKK